MAERERFQIGEVARMYHLSVGIPVHNGGHVRGECVGNASSDGMKLK